MMKSTWILLTSLMAKASAIQIDYDLGDLIIDNVVIEEDNSCTVTYDDGTIRQVINGGDVGSVLKRRPCGGQQYSYPCYCDSSEETGIRCPPYCKFETFQDRCVPENGSIIFGDGSGNRVSCKCESLLEGDVSGNCEPFIATEPDEVPDRNPTDLCHMVFGAIEECPTLVADQEPIEACGGFSGCYNYCDGRLTGCCRPNESCNVGSECRGFGTNPVLAFGCRLPQPSIIGLPSPPGNDTETTVATLETTSDSSNETTNSPVGIDPCLSSGLFCTEDSQCCSERCHLGSCQRAVRGPGFQPKSASTSLVRPGQGGAAGEAKGNPNPSVPLFRSGGGVRGRRDRRLHAPRIRMGGG